jgi:hypothetical protein
MSSYLPAGSTPPSGPPGQVERRRDVRHATTLQVAKLATRRGEELCILRDISPGGAKVMVYHPLTPGEPVVLALKTAHEIAGRVAWCSDDIVGITFDRRIAVLELLAHRALNRFGQRIRPPRLTVDLAAVLEVDDGCTDVRIRDVSQAGMRITANRLVKDDQHCALDIPAMGKRQAIVRWCRNGEAGIALKQPLTYSEFAAWRQAIAGPVAVQ